MRPRRLPTTFRGASLVDVRDWVTIADPSPDLFLLGEFLLLALPPDDEGAHQPENATRGDGHARPIVAQGDHHEAAEQSHDPQSAPDDLGSLAERDVVPDDGFLQFTPMF